MVEKKHSVNYYLITSFFISGIVFIAGIGLGIAIDELKSNSIDDSIEDMSESIQDAELELLVMDYMGSNISCDYLMLKSAELEVEASELGSKLDVFEESNQINTESYIPLKKDYIRVLVKNWITLENIKKSCNASYKTLLYFYNNENCPLCSNQATVLQYYKNLLEGDLMIFAIDAGLNMSVVELLRYNYNIHEYPSLVINGVSYSGYQNLTRMGNLLGV